MIRPLEYYLGTFGVTIPEMETLAGTAMEGGGSYADLYFENSSFRSLLLRDGEVSSGGFHTDFGTGIRTLKGEKTGYAYCENTELKSMMEAAKAAAAISHGIRTDAPDRPTMSFPGKPNPLADRYPIAADWNDTETSSLVEIMEKVRSNIASRDSRIVKIIVMLASQMSDIMMFNSLGEVKYETRPMGTLAVSVIFKDKDRVENTHVSKSFRCGAEMLTDSLIETISQEAVRNVDALFEARRPKGGKMPVVMGAGASGILLHEAMGHAFEADFNRKGQSVFADKLGKRICPEGITIVDDATIKGNRGACNFDDEGIPGQRTCMVENGILTSFLHDRISAGYYGVSPTGNGRRESFRFNPIPRMRATYMESGTADPADIISSVQKGIYVDEFANGQVKIGEGDFTFYVKRGFLIENGRLTMPVKDINVIGNGPQVLADIAAVGNDGKIDDGAWTCGKGQSLPVSCGIPTVLVNNLVVGGE